MDLYCGQCGRLQSDSRPSEAAKSVQSPLGKYDLAGLVAKISKQETKAEAAPKGIAHMSQDAIRKLVQAKKQKA